MGNGRQLVIIDMGFLRSDGNVKRYLVVVPLYKWYNVYYSSEDICNPANRVFAVWKDGEERGVSWMVSFET